MAKISFPAEAFDEEKSHIGEMAGKVAGIIPCRDKAVILVFRKDLADICKELGLPGSIAVRYDQEFIQKTSDKIKRQKNKDMHDSINALAIKSGYTEWHSSLTLDSVIHSAFMRIIVDPKYAYTDNNFIVMSDKIEVPDELLDKYLMIKLAV